MPKILLPIPDDWNGEDWFCTQVQWPQSDKWMAILIGLLTQTTRGRLWDEKTGNVIDAQTVGREIFDRNYPFVECEDGTSGNGDGDENGNGENGTSPPSGGACVEESEIEMPGITWLQIEDGVLYMYFGPCCKIAVEGDAGQIINPPPDDDGDDDEGEPQTWACNKSAGMALRFWAAGDAATVELGGVQQSDRPQTLIDTLPQFNISQRQAQIVAIAYAVDTDENFALSTDDETEQLIKCSWAQVLLQTDGLSSSEWTTMQSVLSSKFTAAQSAYLVTLMQAMSQSTFGWWANAYAEIAADCDCPIDEYNGSVVFQDTRTIILESQGASLSETEKISSGNMRFVVQGNSSDIFQEVHWDENLEAVGTIQEIQIEFPLSSADRPGWYPASGWSDANPTLLSNYFLAAIANAGAVTNNLYPQPNKQVLIATWAAPINLDSAWVDFGMKMNPKDQIGDPQAYRFNAVITYAGDLR